MLGLHTQTGLRTAVFYVRMAIWLVLGVALIVASIVLFANGQPSGVAALMFGAIFVGLGVFRIWWAMQLHRAASQRGANSP